MKQHAFLEFCTGLKNGSATQITKNLMNPVFIRAINNNRARKPPETFSNVDSLIRHFEDWQCLDRVIEADGEVIL